MLALAGGEDFSSPRKGGPVLALTGGGDFSHEDGWSFAPPILSFAKRENAPCTVEERKRGRGTVQTV